MSRALLIAVLLLPACIETGARPVSPQENPAEPLRDEDPPADPRAPVADAGEDRYAEPLQDVYLDGSRSLDPQGLDLMPMWRLIEVPAGSHARMERADAFDPHFFADVAGTYRIALSVTNTEGLRSKHEDVVTVRVVPEDDLYVQLTWDTDVDLDLHLLPTGAELWHARDCTWCNPTPDWGGRDVLADDPSLDWDVIDGFGPETITVPAPADHARLRVLVDLYGQGGLTTCRGEGCPPTTATVDVYVHGERVHSQLATLTRAGEVWEAVQIDWADESVVEVDQFGWTGIDDCQGE